MRGRRLGHARGGFLSHRTGAQEIAFVGGPLDSTTVEDRYRGYVAALGRAALPVDDALVVQTPMSLSGGSQAAEALVDSAASFTAVIAATDEVAFGVISGLRSRGLRVPEDVSVVGMDDVPMASHADPPLTTIRVPSRALGCSAWHLLAAIRDGVDFPDVQCVPFELVVRDSTAPPEGAPSANQLPPDRPAAAARKDR